jgi:hypothetical protein
MGGNKVELGIENQNQALRRKKPKNVCNNELTN